MADLFSDLDDLHIQLARSNTNLTKSLDSIDRQFGTISQSLARLESYLCIDKSLGKTVAGSSSPPNQVFSSSSLRSLDENQFGYQIFSNTFESRLGMLKNDDPGNMPFVVCQRVIGDESLGRAETGTKFTLWDELQETTTADSGGKNEITYNLDDLTFKLGTMSIKKNKEKQISDVDTGPVKKHVNDFESVKSSFFLISDLSEPSSSVVVSTETSQILQTSVLHQQQLSKILAVSVPESSIAGCLDLAMQEINLNKVLNDSPSQVIQDWDQFKRRLINWFIRKRLYDPGKQLLAICQQGSITAYISIAELCSMVTKTVTKARDLLDVRSDPIVIRSHLTSLIVYVTFGGYKALDGKYNDDFFVGHNLSEVNVERLRHALQFISEVEQQLRVPYDRSIWFLAPLLKLGLIPYLGTTHTSNSRRQRYRAIDKNPSTISREVIAYKQRSRLPLTNSASPTSMSNGGNIVHEVTLSYSCGDVLESDASIPLLDDTTTSTMTLTWIISKKLNDFWIKCIDNVSIKHLLNNELVGAVSGDKLLITQAPELILRSCIPESVYVVFFGHSGHDNERDYAWVKRGNIFPFVDYAARFQEQSELQECNSGNFQMALDEALLADQGFTENLMHNIHMAAGSPTFNDSFYRVNQKTAGSIQDVHTNAPSQGLKKYRNPLACVGCETITQEQWLATDLAVIASLQQWLIAWSGLLIQDMTWEEVARLISVFPKLEGKLYVAEGVLISP